MEALFSAVNTICGKIQIVSNWFWDFPTNLGWYANIPVLGNFSLAIILLVGTGIFFTLSLRFVQVRKFKYGIQVLIKAGVRDRYFFPGGVSFVHGHARGPG